jgi:hypothetical protein
MRALKVVVLILSLIPLLTGALDIGLGAESLGMSGAVLSGQSLSDPVLNSQVRFWGAIWFAVGVMLVVAAMDLERHALWFRLICGAIFLSGIAWLVSLVQFGLPSPPLVAAVLIEKILAVLEDDRHRQLPIVLEVPRPFFIRSSYVEPTRRPSDGHALPQKRSADRCQHCP